LKLPLLKEGPGEILRFPETHERGRSGFNQVTTCLLFFLSQVRKMISQFAQIPPHMPGCDPSSQKPLSEFMELRRHIALPSASLGLQS